MKCNFCEEVDHLEADCPKVQKTDNDVEKNETSEEANSKSNLDSDSKKSKPKKPPLLKKKSSVIFICYTLSFLNGGKLCNQSNK